MAESAGSAVGQSPEDAPDRVLESMATGFVAIGRDWTISYLNVEAERVLGWTKAQLQGRNLWDAFPGAEEMEFGVRYHQTMETGEPGSFEAYYPSLRSWFEIRVVGTDDGIGVYFLDITTRRDLQSRAELLNEVGRTLSLSLDDDGVTGLAELLIPTLADWCVITIVEEDGVPINASYAHRDPEQRSAAARYAHAQLDAVSDQSTIWRVLRTGESVRSEALRPEWLEAVFPDPAVRSLLTDLNPSAGLAVPLTARGGPLGVLSLWNTGDRPPHTAAEVALAEEVGLRAGLALDNARLFSRHRRFSEALQHSLLTEPAQPDHCEIVVRYLPAAHEVQVGGDWYDAFLTPSGATVVVIGDVVGHDTTAAAMMGQLRGLVRGIAYTTGDGPASLLTRVDHAAQGLMLDAMATVIAARLEQDEPDVEAEVTRVRWSNAGHPPALLITAEHEIQLLISDAELMLGVDPDTHRTETVTLLDRGATILLYTDGLIERRDKDLDDSLQVLKETVQGLVSESLEDLVDELLDQMVSTDNEDDVAVLAIRFHRQDRPRPAEAGPEILPENIDPT
jgi:PAS domain S-box-containing protein